MEFKLEKQKNNLSDAELLKDLNDIAVKLNKNSVTIDEYEKYGIVHPTTVQRRFKSWFKALEKAGLEPSRSKLNISEQELFENLEEVWIKLGRQPRYTEMIMPLSKFSAGTYANKFGTWQKGLERFVNYINSENTEKVDSVDEKAIEQERIVKHKTKREISDRLRFTVLVRDGFTCKKCGASPVKSQDIELHVDHIIPWSKGGETRPDNLETKCKSCNLGKGNMYDV